MRERDGEREGSVGGGRAAVRGVRGRARREREDAAREGKGTRDARGAEMRSTAKKETLGKTETRGAGGAGRGEGGRRRTSKLPVRHGDRGGGVRARVSDGGHSNDAARPLRGCGGRARRSARLGSRSGFSRGADLRGAVENLRPRQVRAPKFRSLPVTKPAGGASGPRVGASGASSRARCVVTDAGVRAHRSYRALSPLPRARALFVVAASRARELSIGPPRRSIITSSRR